MRIRILLSLTPVVALACATPKSHSGGAAGGAAPATRPAGPVSLTTLPSACSDDGKTKDARAVDVDGDGRPEVIKYYQEVDDPERPGEKKSALIRQDIDLNWDGKIDVCRKFSPAGLAVREEIEPDPLTLG